MNEPNQPTTSAEIPPPVAMLVGTGGRERTEAEYGQLFAAAGLRLTQIIPVLPPYGVIEAVRA